MTYSPATIPVLETERLILRGSKESDLDALAKFYEDEEAARFIGGTLSRDKVWRSIAIDLGHWALRGFGFFAVELKQSGKLIGWCGPWSPEGWPENEIGWGIFPEFQRQGYGSEAAISTLKFAYHDLGWKTAISCIDQENAGSIGVAKKLGASIERESVTVSEYCVDIWRHLPPQQFLEQYA